MASKDFTRLTCKEFIAASKRNLSMLKLFYNDFKSAHNELKELYSLQEWTKMFDEFINR